jgi:hypothetical protein
MATINANYSLDVPILVVVIGIFLTVFDTRCAATHGGLVDGRSNEQ